MTSAHGAGLKEVKLRSRAMVRRDDRRSPELSGQAADLVHSNSNAPLEPERRIITTRRVNVLIQGASPFIADTLAVLRRDLPQPEFTWPDRPIAANMATATVLVHEIGELSPHALDSLGQLVADTHRRVQVIVTSSVVLYELVERGEFPADLYYRLNIVMLTADRGPGEAAES